MGIKHNRQIEEYLNSICTHIKHSEVHQQIRLELLRSIYHKVLLKTKP